MDSSPSSSAEIRHARAEDVELVLALFREYATYLDFDLGFQDFDEELSSPLTFYESILLNENGCVALRRIDEETSEMKRLYVRPEARGTGLGRRLAEGVIDEARARGYRRMLLDTVPKLTEALALYASLGFVDVEPYRYNPFPDARYLGLTLRP